MDEIETPLAALVLDQWADPDSCPEYLRPAIKFRMMNVRGQGPRPVPYFAAGTEYRGDDAVRIVLTGQGCPTNDACREASGLTDSQITAKQLEYEMNAKGINDPGDRELYKAGVIAGMNPDGTPIPGPKWDEYQSALNSESDED